MRRTLMAATAAALTLATAGGVAAQSPARLAIGDDLEGILTRADAQQDGYRYDDHVFEASVGQRLEAILRADDFDAFLEVYGEGETAGEPLGWDDDGLGEGFHSRLRFTVPYSGRFVLRADPGRSRRRPLPALPRRARAAAAGSGTQAAAA